MTIRKVFYYKKLPERKILSSKPDLLEIFLFKFSLCRKTYASESDSFFFKNFISNSDFQWKSLLQGKGRLKSAGKVRNFFIVRGANRVKRLFLKCNVLIEVWFLNKNWTQKLLFRKLLFFHKMIIQKVLFSKSAGTRNCQFTIWNFEKNVISKSHLVGKSLLQNLIPFYKKIHLKLWFLMKNFASKSCLLK